MVCDGLDGNDYDDDNWQNYRTTANDPAIILIPISVILGKRYKSTRMKEEEETLAFIKETEEPSPQMTSLLAMNTSVPVLPQKKKRHRRKASFDESFFVSYGKESRPLEGDLEASNKNTNVHFRQGTFQPKQPRRSNRNKAGSELGGSSVAESSYVHRGGRSRTHKKHSSARSAISTGGSRVAGSSYVHGARGRGNRSELSGNAGGDRVVYRNSCNC